MVLRQRDTPRVNAHLATSLGYLRPLELDGVTISCRRVHLGGGIQPAGKKVALHCHDDPQVEFAVSGAFLFVADRTEIRLRAGQCIVIPPGLPHGWRCVRRGALLGAELAVIGTAAAPFLRDFGRSLQGTFRRIDDPRLAAWARQMLDTALAPAPYAWRRAILGSLFHLWFALILKLSMPIEPWRQAVPYTKPTAGDRNRMLVRQALDFLQANYAMPIRLHKVADHFGISPRHLTRLFRQYGQVSVNTNLQDIRLRRARELLVTVPSSSIKEIAFLCGFSSPSYFTHCFRKTFGRLPSTITDAATAISPG